MEQQIVLRKNDVMQEKWKTCIRVTCQVFRAHKVLNDYVERTLEGIHHFLEIAKKILIDVAEKVSEVFREISKIINNFCEDSGEKNFQNHPHSYPRFVNNLRVNNLRVNIKGFPPPILRCARSRC